MNNDLIIILTHQNVQSKLVRGGLAFTTKRQTPKKKTIIQQLRSTSNIRNITKSDKHNAKDNAKFLTFLSASVSVGKSIWIWEACKVKSDPVRVAVFLIVQTTSSPFSSDTCKQM